VKESDVSTSEHHVPPSLHLVVVSHVSSHNVARLYLISLTISHNENNFKSDALYNKRLAYMYGAAFGSSVMSYRAIQIGKFWNEINLLD
jgi:hypothetical protein